MMIGRERAVIWAAVGLAAAAMVGVCEAKERQTVTVSYVVGPERELPEGLQAVAVIDSGVQTTGVTQSERERKWSTIAADMIEAMLYGGRQWGAKLSVAKRGETQRVLAEHDLKLAGLVEGDTATRVGKLLEVQGLITSRITIHVDIQHGRRSTIDWVQVMGGVMSQMNHTGQVRPGPGPGPAPVLAPGPAPGPAPGTRKVYRDPRYRQDSRKIYWVQPGSAKKRYPPGPVAVPAPRPVIVPAPGPVVVPAPAVRQGDKMGQLGLTLATKEVEEVSRSLTVQCSFSLIDAMTGEAILQYSPPPYQKQDQAAPHFLFGGTIDEADLDPVDQFIGELVERATQEFVGMMVPVRVEAAYELVGKDKAGEAGIRALRADEYETAVQQFEAWSLKEGDPEAVFALGVTRELMGEPQRALEYYRRAVAMDDVDKEELAVYMAAKNRLTKHIERILRPEALAAPSTQPGQQ